MSIASVHGIPGHEALIEETEDDASYEVIDGVRVELPPMSVYSGIIAARLVGRINAYDEQREKRRGQAFFEILFKLRLPGSRSQNRRPDVAYVAFGEGSSFKLPASSREVAWEIVPALAVEVVSPTDFAEHQLRKIREYFRAGVKLVWVIYPEEQEIYVYQSPLHITVLSRDDTLDGGEVLPGLSIPLESLFDPAPSTPTTEGE